MTITFLFSAVIQCKLYNKCCKDLPENKIYLSIFVNRSIIFVFTFSKKLFEFIFKINFFKRILCKISIYKCLTIFTLPIIYCVYCTTVYLISVIRVRLIITYK